MAGMETMVRHDWFHEKIQFVTVHETSRARVELLLSVSRERRARSARRSRPSCGARSAGASCTAARASRRRATSRASSASRAGSRSTPTRSWRRRATSCCARARSRGWRRGRRSTRRPRRRRRSGPEPVPRYDFRPSRPDVSAFPRRAWARCLRDAVAGISDADLIYGDPCGVEALRVALADYLGRVRGVVAEPARVVVTSGYIQGLGLVCRALAAGGVRRIAIEDPSAPEQGPIAARAGLEPVPVPVDGSGIASTRSPRRAPARSCSRPRTSTRRASCSAGAADGAARVAARDRRGRDRGRLRRRVPLRPRRRRGAAGPRPGSRRLRGLGQQDPRARLEARLDGRPGGAAGRRPPREGALGPDDRPDRAARDGGLHRAAASSTATCAACALPTARAATRRSRRSARAPGRDGQRHRGRAAPDGHARGAGRRGGAAPQCARRGRDLHDQRLHAGRVRRRPTLLLGYAQVPEPAIAAGVASSPPPSARRRA